MTHTKSLGKALHTVPLWPAQRRPFPGIWVDFYAFYTVTPSYPAKIAISQKFSLIRQNVTNLHLNSFTYFSDFLAPNPQVKFSEYFGVQIPESRGRKAS